MATLIILMINDQMIFNTASYLQFRINAEHWVFTGYYLMFACLLSILSSSSIAFGTLLDITHKNTGPFYRKWESLNLLFHSLIQ